MSNRLQFKTTKERLSELSKGQMTISALFGAGLAMAFVSATDISELDSENTIDIDTDIQHTANVELSDIIDSASSKLSFTDAFAIERKLQGPGGVFMYNGKLYNTFFEEEWSELSNSDKGDFLASLDLKHSINSVTLNSDSMEISIDNDSNPEINLGDVDADGNLDVVEVDLNNDGHIDVVHSVRQHSATTDSANLRSGSTDLSFEPQDQSIIESGQYEDSLTYTHEALSDNDEYYEFDESNFDVIIDESSVGDNNAFPQNNFESGDLSDPSIGVSELEVGDMIDPSDIMIESGDLLDPSSVVSELETGDMLNPSDIFVESGDIIDPSDLVNESGDLDDLSAINDSDDFEPEDLGLDTGSTELGDEDVTGLDLSEFDF